MLDAIRQKVTGLFAAVIVGALIVPFALWGVNSYFTGDTSTLVAEGDGIAVTKSVYRNALDRYRRSSSDPQKFDSIIFKKQVVEQLVNQVLAIRDGVESGFAIGNQSLSSYIRSQSQFQRDKKFDSDLYKTTLGAQRTSASSYERDVRTDLINKQISLAYSDTALITKDDVDRILALMQQERKFEYAVIKTDRFRQAAKVSDREIEDYYKARSSQYQTEEKVILEYLMLSAEELTKDYQPTEKELRQFYEDGAGLLTTPEKRRVSHILIESAKGAPEEERKKALKTIKEIKKKLDGGAGFAKLARKYSQDPGSKDKGGDLGELTAGMMVKAFEQAAQQLSKKGQISPPVRTQFGYHLIKLTGHTPAKRKPFKTVKAKLLKQLKQQEGEKRFYDLTEHFYNLTYESPDSLAPAAEQLGLKVRKSGWLRRRGNKGIFSNVKVLGAMFSPEVLEQGKNSEAIEINDTTLVSIRLVKHEPKKTKPLGSVRKKIKNSIEHEKAFNKASELQAELVKVLDNGVSIKKVALKNSLTVKKRTITRSRGRDLAYSLVEAVFSAKRPEAGKVTNGAANLGSNNLAIFTLRRVTDGNLAKVDKAKRGAVQSMLRRRRGSGYYTNYRLGLRQKADVKIYEKTL